MNKDEYVGYLQIFYIQQIISRQIRTLFGVDSRFPNAGRVVDLWLQYALD